MCETSYLFPHARNGLSPARTGLAGGFLHVESQLAVSADSHRPSLVLGDNLDAQHLDGQLKATHRDDLAGVQLTVKLLRPMGVLPRERAADLFHPCLNSG